ncbi:MAG: sugar ABC transporter ATP-binding protein [Rhizomicrobium sp.]
MSPVLEVRAVTKRFGGVRALADVSLTLRQGELRALCGENGAGKSTLVKILTGVYRPDSGEILVHGRRQVLKTPHDAQAAGIAFVSQELSIPPHLSVEDNIWLGHDAVPFFHRRRSLRRRAQEALQVVGLSHLSPGTPCANLSVGERQLLEIARMFAREAGILILDEPTATLSNREITYVFQALRRLREQGKTIIFITHRLGEVFEICDSVTVLRNGEEVGSHSVAAVTLGKLIEMMLGRPLTQMYPDGGTPVGTIALSVRDLVVPGAVRGLSFDVPQGRIVCIAGQIGSGAAEALRALAGLIYNAEGQVLVGGQSLRLGSVAAALTSEIRFVSEDRAAEGLFLKLSARENFLATQLETLGRWGLLSRRALGAGAARLADVVGFDRARLFSPVGELSGGNQQKISVGRSISGKRGGVLLMNEPTRGVDVGARAEIYRMMRRLCDEGYAILMTSTDMEEVVGMSDIVLTIYRGAKVGSYERPGIDRTQILSDVIHQERVETAA